MDLLKRLYDVNDPQVFWAAVSGTVAGLVALGALITWLVQRPKIENRQGHPVLLFPSGLLALTAILVFIGCVIAVLLKSTHAFFMSIVCVFSVTSCFWIQYFYARSYLNEKLREGKNSVNPGKQSTQGTVEQPPAGDCGKAADGLTATPEE